MTTTEVLSLRGAQRRSNLDRDRILGRQRPFLVGAAAARRRPAVAGDDAHALVELARDIIGRADLAEPVERALAQVRAWVEHPFHIVENLFRHKKVRYRGLAKNTAQLHTLFALANLVIVRKALLAQPPA
jgi:IS5 family transposase